VDKEEDVGGDLATSPSLWAYFRFRLVPLAEERTEGGPTDGEVALFPSVETA
jgi:hypothetical protein